MTAAADHLPRVAPDPRATGPLQGLRVLDLSRLVAGNMLTLQLGDFGAEVLKIESPAGGDTLRHWRETLPDGSPLEAWWRVYARNKRSVALDLRDAEAMDLLRALVGTADVLVESFRPGTLEAMGLAPDHLLQLRPRLVIVRISGWGQSGPYRDLPGFGSLVEGFSGFAHRHTQGGVPRLPNLALADMVSGLTGAFATMAALREVEVRGGRGQVVDLSLLEPMLAVMGPDVTTAAATGRAPDPEAKIASPRGVYRCRDGGWISMSGSTEAMARRVLEAIGQPELASDPRFATNAQRVANDAELDARVAQFVATRDQIDCLHYFRTKGVTVGPVYDARQVLADPHVAERGCLLALQEAGGDTVMHAVTPRLQGTPGAVRNAAPELGQDTEEVLRQLGVPQDHVDALVARGAIRCS